MHHTRDAARELFINIEHYQIYELCHFRAGHIYNFKIYSHRLRIYFVSIQNSAMVNVHKLFGRNPLFYIFVVNCHTFFIYAKCYCKVFVRDT